MLIYYKNPKTGQISTNDVPSIDVSYWLNLPGWSKEKPVEESKKQIKPITRHQTQPTTSGKKSVKESKGQLLTPQQINAAFYSAFGRNANQAEMNYWTRKTDAELKTALTNDKNAKGVYNKLWKSSPYKTEQEYNTSGTTPVTPLAQNPYAESQAAYTARTGQPVPGYESTPVTPIAPVTPTVPVTPTTEEGGLTPEEKATFKRLNDSINQMVTNGTITKEQAMILKEIVSSDQYVSGQHIPNDQELAQIIKDAATNAETSLSPYYKTLTQRELEDIKTNFTRIREAASRYKAQEVVDYNKKLADTKRSLRLRGMTFSGRSLTQLGSESALKNTTGIKGELPTQRELSYNEQIATWQNEAQPLGTAAERRLGSSTLGTLNVGISTPYGGRNIYSPTGNVTTSDIELQRLKAIEESKWGRVSKYRPFL